MTEGRSIATASGADLTERQRRILLAVVREHIKTPCPVGSKALARHYQLGVSSATIRNEMAELARCGYLYQPHTSAGRVPTEKAYRFYVNSLGSADKLPMDKLSWIHSHYRRVGLDPDKILRMSTKLLADIVKHPAVALEPGAAGDSLTDIEARPVSAHAVRISCAYSSGRQQEFVVRSARTITVGQVQQLGQVMKAQLAERAAFAWEERAPSPAVGEGIPADLLRSVQREVWADAVGRVYVEGTAYILEEPEFQELSRVQAVVQTLGEQQAVRALLSMAAAQPRPSVIIGAEHAMPRLAQCSSVLSAFTGPSAHRGILGVLGPMRMEYSDVISVVDCVAQQVGQVLAAADTG